MGDQKPSPKRQRSISIQGWFDPMDAGDSEVLAALKHLKKQYFPMTIKEIIGESIKFAAAENGLDDPDKGMGAEIRRSLHKILNMLESGAIYAAPSTDYQPPPEMERVELDIIGNSFADMYASSVGDDND